MGSLQCTRVSAELKTARSIVRLTEIQATLQEQRYIYVLIFSLKLYKIIKLNQLIFFFLILQDIISPSTNSNIGGAKIPKFLHV